MVGWKSATDDRMNDCVRNEYKKEVEKLEFVQ